MVGHAPSVDPVLGEYAPLESARPATVQTGDRVHYRPRSAPACRVEARPATVSRCSPELDVELPFGSRRGDLTRGKSRTAPASADAERVWMGLVAAQTWARHSRRSSRTQRAAGPCRCYNAATPPRLGRAFRPDFRGLGHSRTRTENPRVPGSIPGPGTPTVRQHVARQIARSGGPTAFLGARPAVGRSAAGKGLDASARPHRPAPRTGRSDGAGRARRARARRCPGVTDSGWPRCSGSRRRSGTRPPAHCLARRWRSAAPGRRPRHRSR